MKRLGILLIVLGLSLSMFACSGGASDADINRLLNGFIGGLKKYDRNEMSLYLTEFPDHSGASYPDDIFNDSSYVELYRTLYSDITYDVKSYEKNSVTIKVTMPNVAGLYEDTCAYVRRLTSKDPTLKKKLENNDVIFIQEMMRERAADTTEIMTVQYTLSLVEMDNSLLIVCNDELRAFMTGNFFSIKNDLKNE